jgi:hypothetical protein
MGGNSFYQTKNKQTKMKITRQLLVVLFAGVLFASCKKNDDVKVPDNEITDGTSLKVSLTWTLTDGSTPNSFADIDMYLFRGAFTTPAQVAALTPVLSSDFATQFENFSALTSLSDGDYTLVLEYYDITKSGNYTLAFEGTASSKKYTLAPVPFTVAEDGVVRLPVKINKAGQKFTITKQ